MSDQRIYPAAIAGISGFAVFNAMANITNAMVTIPPNSTGSLTRDALSIALGAYMGLDVYKTMYAGKKAQQAAETSIPTPSPR